MTLVQRVATRFANDIEGTDRSDHPNVVEYAVQYLFKGKSIKIAAKLTADKLSGFSNMFFGPGITLIDPKKLEDAVWGRLVDKVVKGVKAGTFREGMEHYALDGTLQQFGQKGPVARKELKKRVIKEMGRDPFPGDDK